MKKYLDKCLGGWDLKQALNWGYFFFDKKEERLKKLSLLLEQNKYQLIEFCNTEYGDWKLYVRKKEVLSPLDLHNRNIEFNKLSESFNIDLYDGWDVEE